MWTVAFPLTEIVTSSINEMNKLIEACGFSLVSVAMRNYSFYFCIQRDACSWVRKIVTLEVGAKTALVRESTYPASSLTDSGLNLNGVL